MTKLVPYGLGGGGRMKMHEGELDIGAELVGRLVAAQFPRLAGLPIRAVQPA